MKIALYIIIFLMGIFFGSFAALAIRRIPKKRNITNKKTTCPHCNHEFGFIDSIPVLSYIFSKGRCRYCGKKIKSDSLIIELLMGLASVGIYYSLHKMWGTMSLMTLTEYLYLMIFATTLAIIAGIDKNNKKIYKPIIFIGMLLGLVHIVFLYFAKNATIIGLYRYVVYFCFVLALSIFTGRHKYYKYRYILEILMICLYINTFVVTEVFLITAVLTMVLLVFNIIMLKNTSKVDESDILAENEKKMEIPIAYWLCISTIIALMIQGIEII